MKRHLLILTLALLVTQAYAQHDEQVTVEGKYRPKASKVDKLKLTPETPMPTYDFPSTEVNPKEAKQKFALDLEKIAPTAFSAKNDKLVTPTENFLMAGIGTRISPLFLYKHNSMLSKTLGLGVGIKHNSSWLGIKDYAPSGYMNNAFEVNLTTSQFDGFQVDGGVFYKNDMYHYYGVNLKETPLTDEQIERCCPRQAYNSVGAHFGLTPTSTRTGEWAHSGSFDYRYTYDKFFHKEHFVDLAYGLGYVQNWWGDKSHPQKAKVDVGLQYDGFVFDSAGYANNRVLLKINPYLEMSDEFYRLHIGLRLDGAVNDEDKFLGVRPDLKGSLFVLDKKLEFYAGLNGGRKLTSFGDFAEENPFIGDWNPLAIQYVKLGFEGGVRTNIMEIVDLHFGVRYRHVDNDPLYETYDYNIDHASFDPVFNTFYLVYDETRTVSVLADARVKLRNSLTADLGLAYNNCKPTVASYAWYRPAAEGRLKVTYDFDDKLAFNTSLLYQGGRYAHVVEGGDNGLVYSTRKLKNVFDLSLGADYKVNDQITAFALIDNLACQKYQLYYNYPVTGIQLFAGVKLKF